MNSILIIEDDAFLRDLISKKISSSGFTPLEAVNGEAALKKVKEERPSLILLDLLIPPPDGFEVLFKLKQDPETHSIPVIILSNLGQKEDVERGMSLGASDYLVKAQFTPEEIMAKIKEVLEKNDTNVAIPEPKT